MNSYKFSFTITMIISLVAGSSPRTADARSTELVEPDPVTTSCVLPADEMKQAIISGGAVRSWMPVNQTDNSVELKYVKGANKHMLMVDVAFSENAFSVHYKDSINLNFKVKRNGVRVIHPRPVLWMTNLSNDIRIKTETFCIQQR
mgnify:CR=1 FL=1